LPAQEYAYSFRLTPLAGKSDDPVALSKRSYE
jgi:hypothetical protein